MVLTAASLLGRAGRLASGSEAAAGTVALVLARLEVRRVAGIEEDHLVDAGGLLGADELLRKVRTSSSVRILHFGNTKV